MWLFFVIPFTVAIGSEILNEDCSLPVHRVCPPNDLPEDLPKTLEELEYACDSVTKFIKCGLSVEERCQFNPEIIEAASTILSTVNEVCDKDSDLHAAIVNNLQCVYEFIEAGTARQCFLEPPDDEQIKESIQAVVDLRIGDSDEDNNLLECLRGIHNLACAALELDKSCGEDAMEALVKIIQRISGLSFESCGEEIKELLPVLISVYKAQTENEV